MEKKIKRNGYTLIEIIISITIFSIATFMITSFFVNFARFNEKIQVESIINSKITYLVDGIKYRIDQSDYINIIYHNQIPEYEKYDVKYITVKQDKVILGSFKEKSEVVLLDGKNEGISIGLEFLNEEEQKNLLMIKLDVFDEKDEKIIDTLNIYIDMQNIRFGEYEIFGLTGDTIVFKDEKN